MITTQTLPYRGNKTLADEDVYKRQRWVGRLIWALPSGGKGHLQWVGLPLD